MMTVTSGKAVYNVNKHFKSLEPEGWNDVGLVNIYNECVLMTSVGIKSEAGQPNPVDNACPWIKMDGTPAKAKKSKKKVKRHKFKPGEKCMVDFEGMYCKAEVKIVDNGKKAITVQLTNMEEKFMIEYPHDHVFLKHFWENDHFGTTNKDIKWGPGDPCWALFYDDGRLYDAVVQEVCGDELVVTFEEYSKDGNHLVKTKHVWPSHLWPDRKQEDKLKREAKAMREALRKGIDLDPTENELELERNLELKLIRQKMGSKIIRERREREEKEEEEERQREERRKETDRREEERRRERKRREERRHRRRSSSSESSRQRGASSSSARPSSSVATNGNTSSSMPSTVDPTLCLPALKDMPATGSLDDFDKDALTNMLVGWYMAGYHTGLYRGMYADLPTEDHTSNGDT